MKLLEEEEKAGGSGEWVMIVGKRGIKEGRKEKEETKESEESRRTDGIKGEREREKDKWRRREQRD